MTVKSRPTPTSSTSSARKPRKSPLDFTTSESSSRAPPSSLEETGLSEFSHELSTVQESVDNKNTRGSPNSNSSSSSIETSAEQLVQALEEAIVSGDSVVSAVQEVVESFLFFLLTPSSTKACLEKVPGVSFFCRANAHI